METLQELLRPVRDQGDRETCLSIALSDGHRGAIRTAPCLAADFLHFHATAAAGVSINDAVPASVARDVLKRHGQPSEVECPYSTAQRATDWKPIPPGGAIWKHTTGATYADHQASIAGQLDAGRPVVLIVRIDDAFWDPVGGVIETPLDPPRASHAVVAVAYASKTARVLVRNSWGEDWGDEGYAWLSPEYLGARCTAVISFEGAVT